ncbi:MAG: LEPR-XLL domain-containing protein, partial [Pirellulaceae bacterium]
MRFTDVIKVKRTRQSRSVRSPCNPRRRSCRPRCIERLEPRLLLSADLFISEFVASNDRTLMDSDGDWPDWLEIHNPTEAPVSLFGWSLTDNDGE